MGIVRGEGKIVISFMDRSIRGLVVANESLDTARRDALDLVQALWNSIRWEKFPGRLRRRVYSVFQDWVLDAAYTSSLHKFVTNFIQNANADAVPASEAERVSRILSSGRDREILRLLREETPALIVLFRARREKGEGR